MTGVEILSSETVVAETSLNMVAFWSAFCVVFVCGMVAIYYSRLRWFQIYMAFFCIAISSIIGILAGAAFRVPVAYETHYKVIVDDSVSMNEFLDKYEILDQEGKIYTVKERLND